VKKRNMFKYQLYHVLLLKRYLFTCFIFRYSFT